MKVANPKLTLYAFHLRNNLAQGEQEPVKDANHLWEQCQQLGRKLNVPRLESLIERLQDSNGKIGITPSQDNPKSNYLELLQPERLLSFSAILNGSSLQLRGEVYPLQIHDTYAVDITLRYPYPHVEIEQLSGLNPQGCLQIAQSKSLIGQSLVLFAQPESKLNDFQAFTNDCMTAILPESDRKNYRFSAQGKFLGSPIFEYSNNQENPVQPSHILIWLNCHPQTETLEAAGDYYQPLINLLCCRHKIIYAYSESRWCNQQARQLYRQLDSKVKGLRQLPSESTQRLKQLKEWLTELSQTAFDYANHLRDLELHRTTIETNNKNYQFWLNQLQAISLKHEDNLELWQQFVNKNPERFLEQIRTDLSYLLPSQQLFQQMIDIIRGIVEAEQAESDRTRQQRLERLITFVSTGLAVSGISSQVASEPVKTILTHIAPHQFPKNPQPGLSSYLFYNSLDVLFHLIIGIVLAIPVGLLVWWMQKRSNRDR